MSTLTNYPTKGNILARLILAISELVITLERPSQIKQYFNKREETDIFNVLNINLLYQRHGKRSQIGQLCGIAIELLSYSDSLVLNRIISPIEIHYCHLNQNCISVKTINRLIEISKDVLINQKLREIEQMKLSIVETILLKMQQMSILFETGKVQLIFTTNSQTEIAIRK